MDTHKRHAKSPLLVSFQLRMFSDGSDLVRNLFGTELSRFFIPNITDISKYQLVATAVLKGHCDLIILAVCVYHNELNLRSQM